MVVFEHRTGAYAWYVRTGSAENQHLQASISEWRLVLAAFVGSVTLLGIDPPPIGL